MPTQRPCVIVPTFWTGANVRDPEQVDAVYDHPTPLDKDGTLPACLESLSKLRGVDHVVVIVATTDPSIEGEAEDRVRAMIADEPEVDAVVFGQAELGSLHRRMDQLGFGDLVSGVSLKGYGAVRNLGLIWAQVLGHEWCVFVDDDQVVIDDDFLQCAADGLGAELPDGSRLLAKSGYYVDRGGSYKVRDQAHWSDMFWRRADAFNKALSIVDAPPRMRISTVAFGGCLALHRELSSAVSFDPWVFRGEDLDYVINARLHGHQVYLDGDWRILHQPPSVPSEALKFRQSAYSFIYGHRKLEFARSQVDLHRITPSSLMPYPGDFLTGAITQKAATTAYLRGLAGAAGERSEYFRAGRDILANANDYARENCDNYFAFQRRWPEMMDRLYEDVALKSLYTGERSMDRSAITGRFPVIRDGQTGPDDEGDTAGTVGSGAAGSGTSDSASLPEPARGTDTPRRPGEPGSYREALERDSGSRD
jgi:hypothetical protein